MKLGLENKRRAVIIVFADENGDGGISSVGATSTLIEVAKVLLSDKRMRTIFGPAAAILREKELNNLENTFKDFKELLEKHRKE